MRHVFGLLPVNAESRGGEREKGGVLPSLWERLTLVIPPLAECTTEALNGSAAVHQSEPFSFFTTSGGDHREQAEGYSKRIRAWLPKQIPPLPPRAGRESPKAEFMRDNTTRL